MVKEILVTRQSLLPKEIKLDHQEDTDARDCAFEDKDQILVMSGPPGALRNCPDIDASDSSSTWSSGCSLDSDYSTDQTDVKEPVLKPPFKQRLATKSTHKIAIQDNLCKMNNNLKGIEPQKTLPYQKKQYQPVPDLYQVDIVRIYAIGLHYHL